MWQHTSQGGGWEAEPVEAVAMVFPSTRLTFRRTGARRARRLCVFRRYRGRVEFTKTGLKNSHGIAPNDMDKNPGRLTFP